MTVQGYLRAILLLAVTLWTSAADGAAALSRSVVMGWVEDADSHEKLGWANVGLAEAERGMSTDADGFFRFTNIPAGTYTLHATRIGYRSVTRSIAVGPDDTLRLTIRLGSLPLQLSEVETMAEADRHGAVQHDPVVELCGGQLQRQLGTTIAETVNNEPGIAERSMGPAPARPVLRGLGGDRLMIVEDGMSTGDLSASSADHAVAIEPMTTERIEVIRGPETLLYGPGILGGVIDVERGIIARTRLRRLSGALTMQGESVNGGGSGGANASFPVGAFVLRMDGSLRSTGDMQTPEGRLENTTIRTGNGAAGVSFVKPWGLIGAGGTWYDSDYGIPGGFVGAHPNGVSIAMNRRQFKLLGEWRPAGALVQRIEAEYAFSRYYHAEYESNGDLGMEFGVLNDNVIVHTHLGRHAIFDEGVIGVTGERRNYATGGLTFTPATTELQSAVFLYEKKRLGAVLLHGAIRYDARDVQPEHERDSYFIGRIHQRSFSGMSGSVSGELPVATSLTTGATITRSWRAPTIEELFSEGPHLAAYSYELGNPDLSAETAWGTELFLKRTTGRWQMRAAVFRNVFDRFIFPRNTGQFSARRADLYEYQYSGLDAAMWGAEVNTSLEVTCCLVVHGSASYVQGELTDEYSPLPMIPPLSGTLGAEIHFSSWTFSVDGHGAAAQDRVDEFEEPTANWARLDAAVQWQQPYGRLLHTVTISGSNITDTEYRSHLSRVKSIMPEPGANLKLLYRVYF